MRKTKVKSLRKYAIALFAVLLLGTGAAFAATDWAGVQSEAEHGGTVTVNGANTYNTNNTPLVLTTPPVPSTVTISGTADASGNYATFNAGGTGNILRNGSDSSPNNITNITNVNFTGGSVSGINGGAIQNRGVLTLTGTSVNNANVVSVNDNRAVGYGGGISNTGSLTIRNYDFNNNVTTSIVADPDAGIVGVEGGIGGAIYSSQVENNGIGLSVTGSNFTNNTARNFGGAIANVKGEARILNSTFTSNKAGVVGGVVNSGAQGGAIVNAATMAVSGSTFTDNSASDMGGAIANSLATSLGTGAITQDNDVVLTIDNTTFSGNTSQAGGGAIYNKGSENNHYNIVNINEGTVFRDNYSATVADTGTINALTAGGGAILNASANIVAEGNHDGILNVLGTENNKVVFENNVAENGGAIQNTGIANINYAVFNNNGMSSRTGNLKTTNGGAIYNVRQNIGTGSENAVTTVANSLFTNNTATSGGAIYNESGTVIVLDSDFSGNSANTVEAGGAVRGMNNSETILRAHNKDMNIGDENSLTNGTDSIRIANTAKGSLQASAGRNLNIYSHVIGANDSSIHINDNLTLTDSEGNDQTFESTGTVRFVGDAQARNSHLVLHNGTLAFDHDRSLGSTDRGDSNNRLTLYGGTLDLLNNEFGPNQLVVQELNLLGNANIKLDVDLGGQYTGGTPSMDALLSDNIGTVTVDPNANLTVAGMKSVSEATSQNTTILFTDVDPLIGHVQLGEGARIIEAPINKYEVTQVTVPTGSPAGALDPGEYFQFTKIGPSDSIVTGPVAAQAAFLLMDNIYRQSFANMDMVTLMTPEQRLAWKMKNKYASAGYHRGVYAPNVIPEERDAWYLRPFANFENVPLKNGPKVSNVFYGSLIGGQSDLIELGHGWDGTFSFFGAYHGSHQAYNGTSIWQNGGSLGGVATAYKGNFWTGVTANVGASAAQSSHAFGSDNFPILMTGAAWKSGYNWGLFNNKFVIQPSYMMSYTFVNVFDYTNAAGVRVTQDPLNAIEIIPGIRLIGNLKNGWQPYLGVNMTWNIMDKTKFYANEVALPQLSVKPFVEYGAGIQKRYGDRFTGFGQAMLRNGGRNGIAFTVGMRWALGN